MSTIEEKVETLKLEDDDTENVNPCVEETVKKATNPTDEGKTENDPDTAAAKKKKKKKKKEAAPPSAPVEEDAVPDNAPKVLGEINENATDEKLCAFCKKAGPTKRCSKRHPKCLPKMFCNETCESYAHEDKKAALVKKEKAKVAAAKKKGMKNRDWKNTDSGQFWWHDQ